MKESVERDTASDAPAHGDRDGYTYSRDLDYDRLNGQAHRVWNVMRDGDWYTLARIAAITGDPEASISARIRDFSKPKFGGVPHERRRVEHDGKRSGQFEYRLVLK